MRIHAAPLSLFLFLLFEIACPRAWAINLDFEKCTADNQYQEKNYADFLKNLSNNKEGYLVTETVKGTPKSIFLKIESIFGDISDFIKGNNNCPEGKDNYTVTQKSTHSDLKMINAFDLRCFAAMASNHKVSSAPAGTKGTKYFTCDDQKTLASFRPCLNQNFAKTISSSLETLRGCFELKTKEIEDFAWLVGHESGGLSNVQSFSGAEGAGQLIDDAVTDLHKGIVTEIGALNQKIAKLKDLKDPKVIQCQNLRDQLRTFSELPVDKCSLLGAPPNPLLSVALGYSYYTMVKEGLEPTLSASLGKIRDPKSKTKLDPAILSSIIKNAADLGYNTGGTGSLEYYSKAITKCSATLATISAPTNPVKTFSQKFYRCVDDKLAMVISADTTKTVGRRNEMNGYLSSISTLKVDTQTAAKTKGVKCGTF